MKRFIVFAVFGIVSFSAQAENVFRRIWNDPLIQIGVAQDMQHSRDMRHQSDNAILQLQIQGAQNAMYLQQEFARREMDEMVKRREDEYRNRERCSYGYDERIVDGVPVGTSQSRNCSGTREEPWVDGRTSVPYQTRPVAVSAEQAPSRPYYGPPIAPLNPLKSGMGEINYPYPR